MTHEDISPTCDEEESNSFHGTSEPNNKTEEHNHEDHINSGKNRPEKQNTVSSKHPTIGTSRPVVKLERLSYQDIVKQTGQANIEYQMNSQDLSRDKVKHWLDLDTGKEPDKGITDKMTEDDSSEDFTCLDKEVTLKEATGESVQSDSSKVNMHLKIPVYLVSQLNEKLKTPIACQWTDPLTSNECAEIFDNIPDIKTHFNTTHLEGQAYNVPVSCYWKYCSRNKKPLSSKSDLLKHLRIHTGEKPFSCPVCLKTFARSHDAIKHIKTVCVGFPTQLDFKESLSSLEAQTAYMNESENILKNKLKPAYTDESESDEKGESEIDQQNESEYGQNNESENDQKNVSETDHNNESDSVNMSKSECVGIDTESLVIDETEHDTDKNTSMDYSESASNNESHTAHRDQSGSANMDEFQTTCMDESGTVDQDKTGPIIKGKSHCEKPPEEGAEDHKAISGKKFWSCGFQKCTKVFRHQQSMTKHRKNDHGVNIRKQWFCRDAGLDKINITTKKPMVINGKKFWPCSFEKCTKVFRHQQSMTRHRQNDHGVPIGKRWCCSFPGCHKFCTNIYNKDRHMNDYHHIKVIEKISDKNIVAQTVNEINKANEDIIHPEGNILSSDEKLLLLRTSPETGRRVWSCDHIGCSKLFTYKCNLNRHRKHAHGMNSNAVKDKIEKQTGMDTFDILANTDLNFKHSQTPLDRVKPSLCSDEPNNTNDIVDKKEATLKQGEYILSNTESNVNERETEIDSDIGGSKQNIKTVGIKDNESNEDAATNLNTAEKLDEESNYVMSIDSDATDVLEIEEDAPLFVSQRHKDNMVDENNNDGIKVNVQDISDEYTSLESLSCRWQEPKAAIECASTFKNITDLDKHLRSHIPRGTDDWFCYWVGCKREWKPLSSKDALLNHLHSHSGALPYICRHPQCGRQYSSACNLQVHQVRTKHKVNTHRSSQVNDIKTYRCRFPDCSRAFTYKGHLYRHRRKDHRHDDLETNDINGNKNAVLQVDEKISINDVKLVAKNAVFEAELAKEPIEETSEENEASYQIIIDDEQDDVIDVDAESKENSFVVVVDTLSTKLSRGEEANESKIPSEPSRLPSDVADINQMDVADLLAETKSNHGNNKTVSKKCRWVDPETSMECHRTFVSVRGLADHLRHHVDTNCVTESDLWICHWKECNRHKKPYSTRSNLFIHFCDHMNEIVNKCKWVHPETAVECHDTFYNTTDLADHLRHHVEASCGLGKKFWMCYWKGCNIRWPCTSKSSLLSHFRSHTQERRCTCLCGISFRYECTFDAHVKKCTLAQQSKMKANKHVVPGSKINKVIPMPEMILNNTEHQTKNNENIETYLDSSTDSADEFTENEIYISESDASSMSSSDVLTNTFSNLPASTLLAGIAQKCREDGKEKINLTPEKPMEEEKKKLENGKSRITLTTEKPMVEKKKKQEMPGTDPITCRWRYMTDNECGKEFHSVTALSKHLDEHATTDSHPKSNIWICHWSGCSREKKSFCNRTTMTVHFRTHSGEHPYRCELCDTNYTFISNYRKHMKSIGHLENVDIEESNKMKRLETDMKVEVQDKTPLIARKNMVKKKKKSTNEDAVSIVTSGNRKRQHGHTEIHNNLKTGKSLDQHISKTAASKVSRKTWSLEPMSSPFLKCSWVSPASGQICGQCYETSSDLAEHLKVHTSAHLTSDIGWICHWEGCSQSTKPFPYESSLIVHILYIHCSTRIDTYTPHLIKSASQLNPATLKDSLEIVKQHRDMEMLVQLYESVMENNNMMSSTTPILFNNEEIGNLEESTGNRSPIKNNAQTKEVTVSPVNILDTATQQDEKALYTTTALSFNHRNHEHTEMGNIQESAQERSIEENIAQSNEVMTSPMEILNKPIKVKPGRAYDLSETDSGSTLTINYLELLKPIVCKWVDPVTSTECGARLNTTRKLLKHMDIHIPNTNLTGVETRCYWSGCQRTKKDLFTTEALRRHIKYHTGIMSIFATNEGVQVSLKHLGSLG